MKISTREKVLLIVTLICALSFLYWQFLLNPLLSETNKTRSDVKTLQAQLKKLSSATALKAAPAEKHIEISAKEEQLNRILIFLDYKMRWFGIELVSLRQSAQADKITINLKFRSTHYQLQGFLNSLSQLKTLLVVDNADIIQEGEKVSTAMRLLSAYR